MAVTAHAYTTPLSYQYDGTAVVDWNTDTIKVALCTSTYTPAQNTHDYFADITNEVTGSAGYTAGGATLATPTVTPGTGTVTLDAADTSWSSSTITARYAIVYKDTGVAATSPLIGYVDFGADVSTTSGTFTITWAGTGIVLFTLS